MDIYEEYFTQRSLTDLPPQPLTVTEVEQICRVLAEALHPGLEPFLRLLCERVAPGAHAAAQRKADFFARIAEEHLHCLVLSASEALLLLSTMGEGPGCSHLVRLLDEFYLGEKAAAYLGRMGCASASFSAVCEKSKRGNRHAEQVLRAWADAEWFTSLPPPPAIISLVVCRLPVDAPSAALFSEAGATEGAGEKDLDSPRLALGFGEEDFPLAADTIAALRATGSQVALVTRNIGEGAGEHSSQAAAAVLWQIGLDIPRVPNQRRGGVVIAETFGADFLRDFLAMGGLPVVAPVDDFMTGQQIFLHLDRACLRDVAGEIITSFQRTPRHLADLRRVGSERKLAQGKRLTARAREFLSQPIDKAIFIEVD